MEGGFNRRGDACHQLLDLIPKEKGVVVRDSATRGRENGIVRDAEERKLQLRLGPPGCEDWSPSPLEETSGESPALSLGYFPLSSKNTTTNCSGAKRLFLETVAPKSEGFLQLKAMADQEKELLSQRTSGKAEQQESLERKACCSPPPLAHAAPKNAAGAPRTRTSSVPVVGWPPIRSFRKNIASSSSKPLLESRNEGSETTGVKIENCRKGLFVKINMDGIPIGRKVDLKAYDCYEKLSSAVEGLFQGLLSAQRDPPTGIRNAKEKNMFSGLLDGSGEYTLVYEDNDGDRMLVGDVPWDMFISTAKRLRVLKSSEVYALSLEAASRKNNSNKLPN